MQEDVKLCFPTFSMAIVVSGSGFAIFPDFAQEDEKLNSFPVRESCAYYIMPEKEFVIKIDSTSIDSLIIFIATCPN
jgi:hypothetical protein